MAVGLELAAGRMPGGRPHVTPVVPTDRDAPAFPSRPSSFPQGLLPQTQGGITPWVTFLLASPRLSSGPEEGEDLGLPCGLAQNDSVSYAQRPLQYKQNRVPYLHPSNKKLKRHVTNLVFLGLRRLHILVWVGGKFSISPPHPCKRLLVSWEERSYMGKSSWCVSWT